ncbi:MAG TPA: biosynthetic-type acetolactate synthase large subunit [Methanomassiliicoccales archaeon]|nr:biosynthetic-type acetolactate synthase large subunit [Methanomassiliicoccales archaeon]
MKGSKALLSLLEKEGVEVMFGYPGGVVIPIYNDLLDSSIHHVLVRHEQCAAHMADGFARATGRPGVCMATSGPGSTNLVTGVATAYADSSPMLVLTGQVSTHLIGTAGFQEADTFSLMMPITKHNFRVLNPSELPEAIKRGMNIAKNGRMGPVHVDLPMDVMNGDVPEALMDQDYPVPQPAEDFSGMLEAVRTLLNAERPILMVGGGAIWANAGPEVAKLAELLMGPVVTTIMGKGIIPEEHPLCMGMLGMHGREAARKALLEADVILAIGTRFSDRTIPHANEIPMTTKIIHLDIDSIEAGKNPRTKVRLVGDAKRGLQLLIKGVGKGKHDTPWAKRVREIRAKCSCNIDIDSIPIKPQKAIYELGKILTDDTIITTEVGQNQMWAAHFLKVKHPRQFITSGGFGTMGFGFPASIGAKIAFRNRPVIDIAGDGSIQMVFHEFATAAQEDLPVMVVVMNNGWLGMVKQWQKLFWDKRYSGTTLRNNPDFVALAKAFGADGVRVEKPSELREAFQKGLRSDVPFLVDVVTDPEEDVLPMVPAGKLSTEVVSGNCPWACK